MKVYKLGQTVLTPGAAFRMLFDGKEIEHPPNWAAAWNDEDFNRFGITVTIEPDPPPPPMPTAEEIARQEGIRTSPDRVDLFNRSRTATAAQMDTWVENATTIPQVRAILKSIIKLVALDSRSG